MRIRNKKRLCISGKRQSLRNRKLRFCQVPGQPKDTGLNEGVTLTPVEELYDNSVFHLDGEVVSKGMCQEYENSYDKSDYHLDIADAVINGVNYLSNNNNENSNKIHLENFISTNISVNDQQNQHKNRVQNLCELENIGCQSEYMDMDTLECVAGLIPNVTTSNTQIVSDSFNSKLLEEAVLCNKKKELKDEKEINLVGRRVVDIQYFLESLTSIAEHAPHMGCTLKNLRVIQERRNGYSSTIMFKCNMCLTKHTVNTVYDHVDVNNAAVLGATSIGSGYSHLKELSSSMDIPTMSSRTYNKLQGGLSDFWEESAFEEMAQAAAEEKRLALECGDVSKEGVPFITVVCDGVWARRSYRSNFSSLSGAAAIVGLKTKKVLYLSVRNKFCIVCKKVPNNTPIHNCYKNWNGSASAMEANIITDGFVNSVKMYGLIYNKMVGDGDSSCYKSILDSNPYYEYNIQVKKLECKNHLLRNYINNIRDLTTEKNAGPLELRKEIKKNLMRFRYAITEAVKHHKNQQNSLTEKTENLRKDILNSPNHILGEHKNCASYYCHNNMTTTNIISDMKLYGLYDKLMKSVRYLANNSWSLVHDVNNNNAEQFNNVIAKYSGGKRINYILKRSYQTRCHASIVSHNNRKPLSTIQKKYGKREIGIFTNQFEVMKQKRLLQLQKYREQRKKKEYENREKSDIYYGPNCQKPDLDTISFEAAKNNFLESLHLTQLEKKNMERLTRNQANNDMWINERKKRVTASKFGEICKKKIKSPFKHLIKSIVSPTNFFSKATQHGVRHEKIAIKAAEIKLQKQIKQCGLFIDKNLDFVAASPDGIIEEEAIVEVKCPYASKDMFIQEAIEKRKITFWKTDGTVNQLHNWYYQIQGQLHVSQYKYCYFCVWTEKELKIEKVERNDDFWKNNIEQKIIDFYLQFVLPELVDSRILRGLEVRDKF